MTSVNVMDLEVLDWNGLRWTGSDWTALHSIDPLECIVNFSTCIPIYLLE